MNAEASDRHTLVSSLENQKDASDRHRPEDRSLSVVRHEEGRRERVVVTDKSKSFLGMVNPVFPRVTMRCGFWRGEIGTACLGNGWCKGDSGGSGVTGAGRSESGAGGDPKEDPFGEVDLVEDWVGGDPEGKLSRHARSGVGVVSAGRARTGVHAWETGPVVRVRTGGHAWGMGPAGCVGCEADVVGRGI